MRKKSTLIIISSILMVALFTSLLWGFALQQQKDQAWALLEAEYQRTYFSYQENLQSLTTISSKVLTADSGQSALLLHEASALAYSAAENLAALPLQQIQYQQSLSFLNQLGDYMHRLANQLNRGQELAREDHQALVEVYQTLHEAYQLMQEMGAEVADGNFVFRQTVQEASLWVTLRRSLGGARIAQGDSVSLRAGSAYAILARANNLFSEQNLFKQLEQFFSHDSEQTARALTVAEEVEMVAATETAQQFLRHLGLENWELLSSQEIVGWTMPLYRFSFEIAADAANNGLQPFYIAVSRQGGQIISFHSTADSLPPIQGSFDLGTSLQKVERLLHQLGYDSLALVAHEQVDHAIYLQYVYQRDGIYYYPGLIRVKISLASGQISGLDTSRFWLNHLY